MWQQLPVCTERITMSKLKDKKKCPHILQLPLGNLKSLRADNDVHDLYISSYFFDQDKSRQLTILDYILCFGAPGFIAQFYKCDFLNLGGIGRKKWIPNFPKIPKITLRN